MSGGEGRRINKYLANESEEVLNGKATKVGFLEMNAKCGCPRSPCRCPCSSCERKRWANYYSTELYEKWALNQDQQIICYGDNTQPPEKEPDC